MGSHCMPEKARVTGEGGMFDIFYLFGYKVSSLDRNRNIDTYNVMEVVKG